MVDATTGRSWLVPVFGLLIATFAVCTAELIVTGLLPNIARDLAVDIPTAGLLIAGYALGVAVAGPVLALLTANISRRGLLIATVVVFILGNILCALSATYWMLLGARLVVACCQGLFFGVAMVIATQLAPEGRQTSAISLVVGGVTLANILGVPLGTAIGNAFGWRASFWVIAIAGVAAMLVLAVLIPRSAGQVDGPSDRAAEFRAATRPVVLLCFATIASFMVGVIALFSYIVPMLTTLSGVPLQYVPWVLFGMGFAGFFGNFLGGRLGDWNPAATMIGILVIAIALLLVMTQLTTSTWGMVGALWAIWFVGFGFPAPVQGRILQAAKDAPNFASTLISTAFNIGIAAGAAVGGAAIANGWGYGSLPWITAGGLAVALVGAVLLATSDRRTAAISQPA